MTKPVYEVDEVSIWTVKTHPLGLVISVKGKTATPGWTDFELSPVEYVIYPKDGIHDVHWTGVPSSGGIQVVADAEFSCTWIGFPEGDLKGVRIHAGSNKKEVLLADCEAVEP